ncbi:hypothetical protein C8R45DRAFT_1087980 [Mycena sanguinolenta]|nr:hypothetical protein C8R45DRAFT_1087980 [Mycena sanguinolenta]
MPRQPTATETRLNNIIACLTPALSLLSGLHDAFRSPFVQSISTTTLTLIKMVQAVKQNKTQCAQLMENIYKILYGIIHLHIKSETAGSLSPATIDDIGKFMQTLHKIYGFVEAQQDGNKIRRLLRSNELNRLLKDCHIGLAQATEVFRV